MPTYEYLCSNCANTWEEMQKISEPALEECPKCHQQTAKRQISGGNFILKGGGWYADLYSSPKPGSSSSSSEGSGSSSTSSSETKSSGSKESSAPAAPAAAPAVSAPSTGGSKD